MASQGKEGGTQRAAVDRSAGSPRAGSIGFVLLVALTLVGAATGLLFVGPAYADAYILALLAVLASTGVFCLFALAAGILRFAGRRAGNPMARAVIDGAFDGLLVTDQNGHVVYANAAYLDLADATIEAVPTPAREQFNAGTANEMRSGATSAGANSAPPMTIVVTSPRSCLPSMTNVDAATIGAFSPVCAMTRSMVG